MSIGTLTKSEHSLLLKGLSDRNKLSRKNYEAVMGWATQAKLDSDLLVLIFQKLLELDVDETTGELRFVPTPQGLASEHGGDLQRIRA